MKCIEDEIPFKVPEGWEWERLGNVSTISRGGSPRPIDNYITDKEDGINWIKIGDAEKDGKYIYTTKEKIKPEGITKSRYVKCDDFLLTNSMSFGRPYILKTDGCIHDGWLVIGNINYVFDQNYLYYALSSDFMYQNLSLLAAGTTVKNLKSDSVKLILFPIPPMNEQKEISKRLDKLIDLTNFISRNKVELIKTINSIKLKILDLAIRGKLVPQNPDDEPASVLLEHIGNKKEKLIKEGKIKRDKKESVIFKGDDNSYYEKFADGTIKCIDEEIPFEIPDTWEYVRIKHIGNIIGGGTPKTSIKKYWNGNIPWLTPADLSGFKSIYISKGQRNITESGLNSSSAQLLPAGSILYSSRAPIGYIAIANNSISTNQGFKSIVPYKLSINLYLYYCMQMCTDDIVQRATGTTFKEISGSQLGNTIIPLPPLKEQQIICELIKRMMKTLTGIEEIIC